MKTISKSETPSVIMQNVTEYQKEKMKSKHVSPVLLPDTLFHFTSQLDWLCNSLKLKMLSPRYYVEDIRYLKIRKIKRIAYPMKCFCDINLHKLKYHLEWYGYYGLAFTKEWGMCKRIQPVQYINPDSILRADFTTAFNSAIRIDQEGKDVKALKDFLFHELMYYKPYSGEMYNFTAGKKLEKCFCDESEWRYIANVSKLNLKQAYSNESMLSANILDNINYAMQREATISLEFNYEDIKYIIIKSSDDFIKISDFIRGLKLPDNEMFMLASKIVVWDLAKGDF